jgi:DHA2 family multidrug resistance protein
MAIAAGFATPAAGRLYDRVGARPLLVAGFTLLAINTWQFSRLGAETPVGWIAFLLVFRGAALGLTVQSTFITALSVVTGPALARATSLVNATRNVVQSVGVALLATVLASTLSPATRGLLRTYEEAGGYAGICVAANSGGGDGPGAATVSGAALREARGPQASAAALARACDEGIAGFERTYRLTFFLSLLALALAAQLPGWPGPWSGRVSYQAPQPEPAGG